MRLGLVSYMSIFAGNDFADTSGEQIFPEDMKR